MDNFRWPTWSYSVPILGAAAESGNNLADGNYVASLGNFSTALAELFTAGYLSQYRVGAQLMSSTAVEGGQKLLTAGRFPNLVKKFGKHAKEWSQWGSISKEAFYKRAVNLADSPIGGSIKGFTSKQGWVFKFNSQTGEFLTIHPKGHIETFFRPTKGMDYYLKQLQTYGQ